MQTPRDLDYFATKPIRDQIWRRTDSELVGPLGPAAQGEETAAERAGPPPVRCLQGSIRDRRQNLPCALRIFGDLRFQCVEARKFAFGADEVDEGDA